MLERGSFASGSSLMTSLSLQVTPKSSSQSSYMPCRKPTKVRKMKNLKGRRRRLLSLWSECLRNGFSRLLLPRLSSADRRLFWHQLHGKLDGLGQSKIDPNSGKTTGFRPPPLSNCTKNAIADWVEVLGLPEGFTDY